MNLLAHAYLSFNNPNIVVGNMISDYVKGKTKFLYAPEIQNGIMLHRAIDEFTDLHAATKEAKEFFRADYRLYAGACVDVVYDHFLANDSNEFENEEALKQLAQKTYAILEQNKIQLPPKFAAMLPYMQAQDWLYHYKFRFGIEKSFGGLVRRSAYLTDSATAFHIFETHYEPLQQCYNRFFPEVKKMAADWLQNFTSGSKTM
ncbi:MAG: ACP phosphodiesterase [Bacteroidota bacterium]